MSSQCLSLACLPVPPLFWQNGTHCFFKVTLFRLGGSSDMHTLDGLLEQLHRYSYHMHEGLTCLILHGFVVFSWLRRYRTISQVILDHVYCKPYRKSLFKNIFKIFISMLCVWVFFLLVCLCTICMQCPRRLEEGTRYPWNHTGAGNQIRVLREIR